MEEKRNVDLPVPNRAYRDVVFRMLFREKCGGNYGFAKNLIT